MIKQLVEDFAKSEFNKTTVLEAIEKRLGRKLVKGKDKVKIDYVNREDEDGDTYAYGAVLYDGEVYGFLEIDYSEPCLVFVPSSKLLKA